MNLFFILMTMNWKSRFVKRAVVLCLAILLNSSWCFGENIKLFGNHLKPPKVWLDQGEAKGILVDIIRELEPELGVTFEFELYPWKRAYLKLLHCEGGIVGLSKNPDRLHLIDYSEAMFTDEIILVVIKGKEFPYNGIEDLKGKSVGVQRGASYGSRFEMAKDKIFIAEYDDSSISRLLKLLYGRMDVALINPGKAALKSFLESNRTLNQNKDRFIVLKKPFQYDQNYLGFAKSAKKKAFLQKFNQALLKAKQTGKVQKIINRYMQ